MGERSVHVLVHYTVFLVEDGVTLREEEAHKLGRGGEGRGGEGRRRSKIWWEQTRNNILIKRVRETV